MKSILLHLTDGQNTDSSTAAAQQLATRFQTPLDGVFALPALASTFWGYEAAEFLPVLQQRLEQTASGVLDGFRAHLTQAGQAGSATLLQDAYLSTLAETAMPYDLLVTPQPKAQPDTVVEMEFQVPDIIVHTACPTLVVPRGPLPAQIGSRVCVAWNNSRESSRALRDALPLLRQAQDILILSIHSPHHPAHGTQAAQTFLTRHGLSCRTETIATAEHHNVTHTLLSTAQQQQTDLLVMGAWGHSRFRELILGGVTRGILETSTLPVFMSH